MKIFIRHLSFLFCLANGVFFSLRVTGQVCPPNIDFETGTFAGWTCYTGSVSVQNATNVISLSASGPIPDRHTIISGKGNDPYGGFPMLCPNGSGYSIKLGNETGGGQAEGISYQFTIPPTENRYNLIYNYAVVFQDPNHEMYQQPRMEIEIKNVTDNSIISCSSFTWIPYGTVLPGFFESPNPGGPTPVWCKDWTAVTINLDGLAGKTIQLSFKTADCTFTRHFGYAYIDVNSECSNTFLGATFCPDDTAVNVVAPYGYQNYTWYDSTLVNILGTQQTLTMPPPKPGTTIAVKVEPYSGYGCPQTLYARLLDTLTVKAIAGADALSCNETPVRIGSPPKPGLVYSWSPTSGLSDPNNAHPFASPAVTTSYIVTARNSGGGCANRDTVKITASIIEDSLELLGKSTYCIDSDDSSVLRVQPTDNIQWFKNNAVISGANKADFRATESGTYYALLKNKDGCSVTTEKKVIFIDKPRPGVRYPVQYAIENLPLTLQARDFGESILWNPATYLDNPAVTTPVFTGSKEQTYTIEITTPSGCITVDTLQVKTVKDVQIYVPSAFTPNGDGMNDFLRPTLMGVKELRYFRVYNRWGQLVYESKSAQPGWDGNIKSLPQQTGAVVWIAEAVGVDGRIYQQKGTSVLVR